MKLVSRLPFPYRAPSVPAGVEPAPIERHTGIDYDTDWARRLPARWTRAVVLEGALRPAVAAIARPRRQGLDRLADLAEREQPVIFAANHHSHVDTPLLLSSLPEPWRYRVFVGAAADYFFRTRVTGTLSALVMGAIPIERTRVTRRSANQAAGLVADGWSMLIFPEGGRSPDGWGQPFRGGAAYLSIRCQVPVVPIHVQGTGRILPKGARSLHPGRTVVTFGRPVDPVPGEDSRRFAARLEREVAALADEATTDWYSARRRAHATASPGLTGPQAGAWRRVWVLGDRKARRRPPAPKWPRLS